MSFDENLLGTFFVLLLVVISIIPTLSLKSVFTDDDIRTAVSNRDNGEYAPISQWDVSAVTNMAELFSSESLFNQDLSGWDVSKVTTMFGMFYSASKFNQDLSGWDVSAVSIMSGMFNSAYAFNQDLSNWNVSQVSTMRYMFHFASAFNGDLSGWDVSAVTDMTRMFGSASKFNQDLSNWDVSAVSTMADMFYSASSFDHELCWDLDHDVVKTDMFKGTQSAGFGCPPSDSPTTTAVPSARPTAFPTPAPTPPPANSDKCTDKYSRVFKIRKLTITCKFLSKLSVLKRVKWCKMTSVRNVCPDTCDGMCICNDNTLSTFSLNNMQMNCSWLNHKRLKKVKLLLCRKFPEVKGACEDTCNGWC